MIKLSNYNEHLNKSVQINNNLIRDKFKIKRRNKK